MRFEDLEIRRNSLEMINNVANANTEYDWKLLPGVYDIPLKWLLPNARHDGMYRQSGEKARIESLAEAIQTSGWITAVIVEYEHDKPKDPDYSLIEGQHRARAMKLLGFDVVIAQVYEIQFE